VKDRAISRHRMVTARWKHACSPGSKSTVFQGFRTYPCQGSKSSPVRNQGPNRSGPPASKPARQPLLPGSTPTQLIASYLLLYLPHPRCTNNGHRSSKRI
jgi:hypothetical protein